MHDDREQWEDGMAMEAEHLAGTTEELRRLVRTVVRDYEQHQDLDWDNLEEMPEAWLEWCGAATPGRIAILLELDAMLRAHASPTAGSLGDGSDMVDYLRNILTCGRFTASQPAKSFGDVNQVGDGNVSWLKAELDRLGCNGQRVMVRVEMADPDGENGWTANPLVRLSSPGDDPVEVFAEPLARLLRALPDDAPLDDGPGSVWDVIIGLSEFGYQAGVRSLTDLGLVVRP
jgi:hypothetical protein